MAMIVFCGTHPRYRGQSAPRTCKDGNVCFACLGMFDAIQTHPRDQYSSMTAKEHATVMGVVEAILTRRRTRQRRSKR